MTSRPAVLVVVTVLTVLGMVPAHAVGALGDQPSISLTRDRVRTDAEVTVTGKGLAPGSLVSAVLCGNSARRGSLDCALASAVEVGVRDDGTFATSMRMTPPPMPCPCVVLASGGTPDLLVAGVRLSGHPLLRGRADRRTTSAAQAQVEAVEVRLERRASIAGWFGLPVTRTLRVQLTNEGSLAAVPRLELGWGRVGGEATNFVQTPRLSTLTPRASTTVEVPVRFDALTNGELLVAGSVVAGGEDAAVADTLTIRPWGLFAIAGVLLLALGLRVLVWVVRRPSGRPEAGRSLSLEELFGSPAPARMRRTAVPSPEMVLARPPRGEPGQDLGRAGR